MNEQKCRRIVRDRSEDRCEMCGAVAHETHHRKNRSQGGQWTPANCLHLCVFDHRWVTVNPAAARDNGWAVRRAFDPSSQPVWLYGHGWSLIQDDGSIEPCRDIPEEITA